MKLVLGAGTLINPRILEREIRMIQEIDPSITHRIFVDEKAGIITPEHESAEGGTRGELHERIGSTGEGVGAARIGRINRDENVFHLAEYDETLRSLVTVTNTVGMLSEYNDILVEGTQGSGLSIVHGSWPYVTSHDTNAAQMLADSGISPTREIETVLVARTMPIRVAGKSGPLPKETNWDEVSNKIGRRVEEKTTVTKKIRRIAYWDNAVVDKAVMLNNPSHMVITFMDYLFPQDTNKTKISKFSQSARDFINYIETAYCPVSWVGTGFDTEKGWFYAKNRWY